MSAQLERNKEVAVGLIEAIHSENFDRARELMSPKIEFYMHPRLDPITGLDGFDVIASATGQIFEAGSVSTEWLGVYAEGDTVVLRVITKGRTKKGYDYANHYVIFITVEDGLAVRLIEYTGDTAYRTEAFGLDEMSFDEGQPRRLP